MINEIKKIIINHMKNDLSYIDPNIDSSNKPHFNNIIDKIRYEECEYFLKIINDIDNLAICENCDNADEKIISGSCKCNIFNIHVLHNFGCKYFNNKIKI